MRRCVLLMLAGLALAVPAGAQQVLEGAGQPPGFWAQ